jgi:hypothetical protein
MNFRVAISIPLLCLLILLSAGSVYSQNVYRKGFIVKASGDTVSGFVKVIGNKAAPSGCYFKSTPQGQEVAYTVSDLAAFGLTDYRYYQVIQVNNEPVMAQALVAGKLSLFSVNEKFYIQNDSTTKELIMERVKLENNQIHEKKIYVGTLRVLMSDCPTLNRKIDQARFVESSLTSVVEAYNHCAGADVVAYKKNLPSLKLTIKPVAGVNYTHLAISVSSLFKVNFGYLDELKSSSISPTVGIGFSASTPKITDNFSFDFDVRYLSSSLSQTVIYSKSTYDYNKVSFKYSAILLPITFAYKFDLNPQLSMGLRGGLLKTFKLAGEFDTRQRQTQYPNVPERSAGSFSFYKTQTGFSAGISVEKNVGRKQLYLDARFDNIGPVINSVAVGFLTNVYSLTAGISL